MARRRGSIGIVACACTLALACAPGADAGVQRGFGGVSAQSPLYPKDVKRMRAGEVGAVRLLIPWASINSAPDSFDWSATDREFAAIARARARPLPFLFGTPRWLSRRATDAPPLDRGGRRAWSRFVRKAVARYGSGGRFWKGRKLKAPVRRWQIWNEQNLDGLWKPEADPAAYGRLLRIASRTIGAQDPRASVIIGGLPPAGDGIRPAPYLESLYARKRVRRAFDGVAIHPYGTGVGDVRHQVKLMRRVMRRGGTPRRPLYVTEIGWGSRGPRGRSLAGSPARQAKLLRRTYRLLAGNRFRWRIRAVYWFAWRDARRENLCHFCDSTGLFELGSDPKPAWGAWKRTMRSLRRG